MRELNRNAEALLAIFRAIDLEPQDPILLNEEAAFLEQLKPYPQSLAQIIGTWENEAELQEMHIGRKSL